MGRLLRDELRECVGVLLEHAECGKAAINAQLGRLWYRIAEPVELAGIPQQKLADGSPWQVI
ncbi:MAG: hypothetical protein ACRDQ4_10690 [Pseudonocardiaceae bacterium]